MFKKLNEKLSSAAAAVGNAFGENSEKVGMLRAMGFDASKARDALSATNGNVDRAAELLLLEQSNGNNTNRTIPVRDGGRSEDDEMHRIMQESLRLEDERRIREAKKASTTNSSSVTSGSAGASSKVARTAAMNRAAEAALSRAEASQNRFGTSKLSAKGGKKPTKTKPAEPSNLPSKPVSRPTAARSTSGGLSTHHPNVQVPKQLKDKSKEEQLLRCANRLSPYPPAVDTLLRALTAVRDDPSNEKYRKVDKRTPGYQRTLEGKPGAEDMFLAMNFRKRGPNELVLDRAMVDPALLYLGISALEGARASVEYRNAKQQIQFNKVVVAMRNEVDQSESEALARAALLGKCPSEPPVGRGALVQVSIGDDIKLQRRFDGDDVLRDVIHWLGSNIGSELLTKLYETKDWSLVDLNQYPVVFIDAAANADKTLQNVGCWPSGKLELRPTPEN